MSKHNQYYSDWKESPDDDYYRDQAAHRERADEQNVGYWHKDTADLDDVPSYQTSDQPYVSGNTYESGFVDGQDGYYPTPYHPSDYYDRESERGFNLVNIADYRDGDYEEESPHETEFYAAPQQGLPHDSQDIIGDITSSTKVSGIQVVADDFVDIPKSSAGFRLPKVITVTGTILFGIALGAWILYSSQPELSAADIVQLDTYDGQQDTPAIFNLTDLKDCTSLSDCIKDSLAASRADIAKHAKEMSALREIPAVNQGSPAPAKQEIVDQNPPPVVIVSSQPDQPQVQKQWSIIRATPNSNGDIITSLAKGVNVRIINSEGNWYEIEALNSKGTRGYMHRSTIDSF